MSDTLEYEMSYVGLGQKKTRIAALLSGVRRKIRSARIVRALLEFEGPPKVSVSWQEIAVLAGILLVAFVIRWGAYDNPLNANSGDGARDYATAMSLVRYHEFPLGMSMSHLGVETSPAYFYILGVFAAIHTTPDFVNFCYLLLEVGTIFGFYALTRRPLGVGAAQVAAFVAAFAPRLVLEAANGIWQPPFMQFFVVFAAAAFVRGFYDRSLSYLCISAVLVMIAMAMHVSVFGLLPLYCLMLATAAYRARGFSGVTRTLLLAAVAFAILFAPAAYLNFATNDHVTSPGIHSFSDTLICLKQSAQLFMRRFYEFEMIPHVFPRSSLELIKLTILGAFATAYFLAPRIPRLRKFVILVFGLFAIQQIIAMSIFNTIPVDRDLSPVTFVVYPVFGAFIYETIRALPWSRFLGILLAVYFVMSIVYYTPVIKHGIENAFIGDRPKQAILDSAAQKVAEQIRETGADPYDFEVYIRSDSPYALVHGTISQPALMWLAVEPWLGLSLVHHSNSQGGRGGMMVPRGTRYVFYVCMGGSINSTGTYELGREGCLQRLHSQYPQYDVRSETFDNPYLYVFFAENRQS